MVSYQQTNRGSVYTAAVIPATPAPSIATLAFLHCPPLAEIAVGVEVCVVHTVVVNRVRTVVVEIFSSTESRFSWTLRRPFREPL